MSLSGLKIALVGPLPPPHGGIANQTRQLAELLEREGACVTLVAVNSPYWPRWIGGLRGLRAFFRLLPFVRRLWSVAGEVEIFHVMANSGWSWHLFAAPAVWVARLRGIPAVVNYRGGEAQKFLRRSGRLVAWTLRRATALVVPSGFLKKVFATQGLEAVVVPNIIDLEHFHPAAVARPADPHLVVARNLDPIYDIGTALSAFALVRKSVVRVRMTVAGSGPERPALEQLAAQLGVAQSVLFSGELDRAAMAELYRSSSVALNPSLVDNMPNSVLEALASGVPVVSTDVGGVPFIVRHESTALLVPPGDPAAMAGAVLRILLDKGLAERLACAGLADARQYGWNQIKARWAAVYERGLNHALGRSVRGRTA